MSKRSTKKTEFAERTRRHGFRPILSALNSAKTVLVANARAAEIVRERYSLQMLREGRSAWPSARVLPWRVWLANYYTRTQVDAPTLLSAEQALLIWEQIIGQERAFSIQQVGQFTRLAAEAWATAHLWQVPLPSLQQKFPSFEVDLFAKWQEKFQRRCDELRLVDSYQAASNLLQTWNTSTRESTPQAPDRSQQILVAYHEPPSLLKALAQYCWQLAPLNVPESSAAWPSSVEQPPLHAYAKDTSELQAAIEWAVEIKQSNPQAAVAIALSDSNLMRSAMDDSLRRYSYQCDDQQRRATAAEIAMRVQQPLSNVKLVQAAIRVLRIGEQISCDEVSALLLDPYLGEWSIDQAGRAKLDRDIRNDIRDLSLTTQYFKTLLGREAYQLDALHSALGELLQARENAPHQQSLIAWQAQFEHELALLNWPAASCLTSDERAAKNAWQQALDSFVSLSPLTGVCSRRHALHRLNTLLQQRVFNKPEISHAIRVINFDEAVLVEADAIAWCGLGQYQWPNQTTINPLLPFASQRDAQVPGTNPALDALRARNDFVMNLAAVPNNRCSYTQLIEGVENPPVSLFANVVESVPAIEAVQSTSDLTLDLEEFQDEYGLPLASEVALRNAVRFFADQAACPFRAYAVHRLNSQALEAPALGLDARRRGELVHLVIAKLWSILGSQQKLLTYSDEKLHQLISQTVYKVVDDYRPESRQLPQYWHAEGERLTRLLQQWFEVERARQEFSVRDTEKSVPAEVAAFRFRVRIDRIDRLYDETLAVIDFKTGKETLSSWAVPRIEQPQLPIYAVNLASANVSAIAYAQLRNGECRFVELPKAALTKGTRDADWAQQLDEWRADLNRTAAQMADGLAVVDPKGKSTCRYCQQRLVCRIGDALDDDERSDSVVDQG